MEQGLSGVKSQVHNRFARPQVSQVLTQRFYILYKQAVCLMTGVHKFAEFCRSKIMIYTVYYWCLSGLTSGLGVFKVKEVNGSISILTGGTRCVVKDCNVLDIKYIAEVVDIMYTAEVCSAGENFPQGDMIRIINTIWLICINCKARYVLYLGFLTQIRGPVQCLVAEMIIDQYTDVWRAQWPSLLYGQIMKFEVVGGINGFRRYMVSLHPLVGSKEQINLIFFMKVLSWNCRGMGNKWTKSYLREI